jgi:hypothetical protein
MTRRAGELRDHLGVTTPPSPTASPTATAASNGASTPAPAEAPAPSKFTVLLDHAECQNSATSVDLVFLGSWFVFIDQATENGSALDPFR